MGSSTAVMGRLPAQCLALLSVSLAGPAFGAGLEPVAVSRVGYIRADADPENGSCADWDPAGSGVAWDYGNRSLVVELPEPRWVTQVVVQSDKPAGEKTQLTPETVSVLTSMDNVRYVRCKKPPVVKIERAKEPGKVWRVGITGLGVFARYLKLKQTYNGAEYGFAMTNLKEAVSVFTDDTLGGPVGIEGPVVGPAQMTGRLAADVRVTAPRRDGFALTFEAENTETWEVTRLAAPFEPGKWTRVALKSPQLIQGGYQLVARLRFRDTVVAEAKTAFRVHTGALDGAGELPKGIPAGGALVLRDLPGWCEGTEPFAYSLPNEPAKPRQGVCVPKAGQVKIRLPITGECAVYVAVENPWPELAVQWGDHRQTIPTTQADWEPRGGFQELFVGFGDFAAAPLIVGSPKAPCRISHLRLARLTPAEAKLAHHVNDPTHNRRVIYNNDGFSELWGVKGWDKARLLQLVERYQGTDTEVFEMAALVSGWVNFPSKFASFYQEGDIPDDQWVRANDKMAAELFRQLERDGIPIFPTLAGRGREIGVPVWGSLRMSGYYGLQEKQTMQPFNGKLWHEHPEMRIRGKDGKYRTEMSFAWPEVQRQRIGVLGELAEMGCEGVMMDFCRYPNILGYDEPLVQGFKAKYGVSPLDLPDGDPRWIGYRCDFLNEFFRAVRRRIEEVGRQHGRKLRISVRLPASGYREYGFDPATWAREKLMDIFIPHFPGLERDFDVRPWVAMAHPHGVLVYPGIEVTKHMTSNTELTDAEIARGVKPGIVTVVSKDDYRRKVWQRYRQGADGTFLFNIWTIGHTRNLLGDKESLRRWSYFEDPVNLPRENVVPGG